MENVFEGKVIAALPKQQGVSKTTGKAWCSQEYVVEEYNTPYPKKMCFSIFGEEKIQQAAIIAGEPVIVHFDIDAREYNGRWFNSIRAWKIERPNQQAKQPTIEEQNNAPVANFDEKEKGDLPF